MAFLKQISNGETINIFSIDHELTIGRGIENDVVIDDPTVSQTHAKITLIGEGWCLQDCESTNGIMLHGKQERECELTEGLSFTIGTQQFEFTLVQSSDLDKTLRIKKSWIPGVYYTE